MKNYMGYEIKIVREGKEAWFEIYSDEESLIHREMDEYYEVDDEYLEGLAYEYIEGVVESWEKKNCGKK